MLTVVQSNKHEFKQNLHIKITNNQPLKQTKCSLKSICKMLCLNLFKEAKSTLSGRAFQAFRTRWLKKCCSTIVATWWFIQFILVATCSSITIKFKRIWWWWWWWWWQTHTQTQRQTVMIPPDASRSVPGWTSVLEPRSHTESTECLSYDHADNHSRH